MTKPVSPDSPGPRDASSLSYTAHLQAWARPHVLTFAVGAVLLVLMIVFSLTADSFFTAENMLNMLRQIAPTLIVAVAMTFVITTAGIDLSVGSIVALSGSLLAIMIHASWDPTLALVLVLLLGVFIGAVNGWFSAYQGLPSFIVTLATLSIVRGAALLVTGGYSTPISGDAWIIVLGQGRIFNVPTPAIIAIIVTVLGWLVFTQTPFGRYVVGLGSNGESLRRAGVVTAPSMDFTTTSKSSAMMICRQTPNRENPPTKSAENPISAPTTHKSGSANR